MRSLGGCTETENPLTSVSGFFYGPALGAIVTTGTAAALAETRREYVPVGLGPASMRATVSASAAAVPAS
jgi:hypothetical protein